MTTGGGLRKAEAHPQETSPSSLPLFRYRSPSGHWGMPTGPTLRDTALPSLYSRGQQFCVWRSQILAVGSRCGPAGAGVHLRVQSCPSDPGTLGPGMTPHTIVRSSCGLL